MPTKAITKQNIIPKLSNRSTKQQFIFNKSYQAVFIVDSNMELNHFDKLLRERYGVAASLATIDRKEPLMAKIRKKVASSLSEFTALIEGGFECVSDYEGRKVLRKRK